MQIAVIFVHYRLGRYQPDAGALVLGGAQEDVYKRQALMGITVSSGGILLNSILPAHSSALVGVVVLAAVLALYALSWRLSVAWYGKAEQ